MPDDDDDDDDAPVDEFRPSQLYSAVIAPPLSDFIFEDARQVPEKESKHPKLRKRRVQSPYSVIIDLNVEARGGTDAAKKKVRRLLKKLTLRDPERIKEEKSKLAEQQIFARLSGENIASLAALDAQEPITDEDLKGTLAEEDSQQVAELLRLDPDRARFGERAKHRAIYHIWLDFPLRTLISRSLTTVKADAGKSSQMW